VRKVTRGMLPRKKTLNLKDGNIDGKRGGKPFSKSKHGNLCSKLTYKELEITTKSSGGGRARLSRDGG